MKTFQILFTLLLLSMSIEAKELYVTFTVEAQRSANLAFSSGGIVAKVEVEVNSVVKRGEVLAILQNDDLKAMLRVS